MIEFHPVLFGDYAAFVFRKLFKIRETSMYGLYEAVGRVTPLIHFWGPGQCYSSLSGPLKVIMHFDGICIVHE